jgi:translation initiation factor IF-1
LGADEAVKDSVESGSEREQVAGTVVELLPSAAFRVELDSRALLVAHAGAGSETNFVRLRPKDRVLVELSPHDSTRARIVKLLGRG